MMTVTTILKGLQPVEIDEAQNGAIAVAKFKEALKCQCKRAYQLVLMDI
jgi:hypothetical protein